MTGPVRCHACGEEWPRHPALEVECPKCYAPVGTHCKKPSGHTFWSHELPHVDREQLALDEGLMERCTHGRWIADAAQAPLFTGELP